MSVNQFSETSPSLQADSITISAFSTSTFHSTTISTSQSDSRSQTGNGHYFMLIVEIIMQITIINGFCSIPEIIQVIIHPNSKFKSGLGLEIAKNRDKKRSISNRVFRSKINQKTKQIVKTKS